MSLARYFVSWRDGGTVLSRDFDTMPDAETHVRYLAENLGVHSTIHERIDVAPAEDGILEWTDRFLRGPRQ